MRDISNHDDLIDVRDIIARVEELGEILEEHNAATNMDSERVESADARTDLNADAEELDRLTTLLADLAGNGGDEQWRGDWYPITLIRDSYFEDYAREFAEEIGAIPDDARWPCTCIDWKQAARELRMDYTSTEFDGVTYWYR